ncbi:MAG: DUF547 domain-containing protein [Paludibacter sp.]|nr:DUF547 domain-containing protein [Paludibacter sp.]
MKTIILTLSLVISSHLISAQISNFSHEKWNGFLNKYVSATGNVNYKAIKSNAAELDNYLQLLKTTSPKAKWTVNEAKAYWINAYNAFTVKLIVDNYPLKSIKDIGAPWDKKFITIENKTYTLNDIENKILRPTYKDARIHFAIVCAAKSCPILSNKAYLPETLDVQLDESAKRFLNDTGRNKITNQNIEISEIFSWFTADFTQKSKLIDFLNQYSKVKIDKNAKISYLTYNWNLNE